MEVKRNLNVILNYNYELQIEKMENAICDAMHRNRIFLWNFVVNKVCLLLIPFTHYPLSYFKQSYFLSITRAVMI